MHIDCPHCQSPIENVDEPQGEVVCSTCGSVIMVDPNRTRTFLPTGARRRFGKYELLEQLGVGAFGTVCKARDTELDRIVAIKIPRAGSLTSKEDVDRFLREARSAAQVRHAGIVSIYDAGETEETCFLVSEYVQGSTLADRLSAGRMSFRGAAELIAELADALHVAHQQGVIHRDIKPSNIMIDLSGRPHVMDFGLAKRDAGETTMTLDGQILGTPAYMPPEQARGDAHKVDARGDVYSLGVILYELLTGELPFRGNSRMLIVQVVQDEPRPPRRINDKIPRDLETICLKAMCKAPARRYATARGLADDLRRWLSGHPITARPVGNAARLWRWAKRNPRLASLAASVFTLLFSVAIGSSFAIAIISEKERMAVTAGNKAAEERARADENASNARTQRNLALEAFQKMIFGVQDQLRDMPATHEFRKEMLRSALEGLEHVVHASGDGASPDRDIAVARQRMGDIYLQIDGTLHKAKEHYNASLRIQQELIAADPANAVVQRDLAISLERLGDLKQLAGDLAAAHGHYLQALELFEDLLAADLESAVAQRSVSIALEKIGEVNLGLGETREARSAFLRSLEIREEIAAADPLSLEAKRDLSISYNKLGQMSLQSGETAGARKYFEQSLKLRKELVAAEPESVQARLQLSFSFNNLGDLMLRQDDAGGARTHYENAIKLCEKLSAADPANATLKRELAVAHTKLGDVNMIVDDAAAARRNFDRSLELREELAKADPQSALAKRDLAGSYERLGRVSLKNSNRPKAKEFFDKSLALYGELAASNPESAQAKRDLFVSFDHLGDLSLEFENTAAAREYFEQALIISSELATANPADARAQLDLKSAYCNLGEVEYKVKEFDKAVQWFEKARSILKGLDDVGKLAPADRRILNEIQQAIDICKKSAAGG